MKRQCSTAGLKGVLSVYERKKEDLELIIGNIKSQVDLDHNEIECDEAFVEDDGNGDVPLMPSVQDKVEFEQTGYTARLSDKKTLNQIRSKKENSYGIETDGVKNACAFSADGAIHQLTTKGSGEVISQHVFMFNKHTVKKGLTTAMTSGILTYGQVVMKKRIQQLNIRWINTRRKWILHSSKLMRQKDLIVNVTLSTMENVLFANAAQSL